MISDRADLLAGLAMIAFPPVLVLCLGRAPDCTPQAIMLADGVRLDCPRGTVGHLVETLDGPAWICQCVP